MKRISQKWVFDQCQLAIIKYAAIVGLQNPIGICFCNAKSYYAKYETELTFTPDNYGIAHCITISMRYTTSAEEIESTIAHELVHAWQAENGIEINHGKDFRAMRKRIKKEFGVDIGITGKRC